MRNGVQLIAYADRFGAGGIAGVHAILDGPLSGVFTGVHLLPFYRPYDGADAGFDPTDHGSVDPRLGKWEDIALLARSYDVTADMIVNHISSDSEEFRDFAERGDVSSYVDLFVDVASVFPGGPTAAEQAAIYRPRPTSPFTVFTIAGEDRLLWTTFTDRQVDIDVKSVSGSAYLDRILGRLDGAGVAQVRLDAVGYAIKTAGTSCFMTPQTLVFIDDLSRRIHAAGMEVLVEIHAHYETQIGIAARVDRVYDFALPPLVLHTLYTGSAAALKRWLSMAPRNAVTVLDTHDGIGVIDVGPEGDRPGLLSSAEIDALVESIHTCTNGESLRATGSAASNLDLYQVNTTFFSALNRDHDAYVIARLIHLMSPGIPQVYYAGLLATPNDMDLLETTGVGRDINRPFFGADDIERAVERPVVARLLDLVRLRSTHPAFDGEFSLGDGPDHTIEMTWRNDNHRVSAMIDVRAMTFALDATDDEPVPA
ncbi:MAG: sucrose phosphorylase [Actinomycetota bacterium]|nr:sucrose phosphorylase [Actinomycetota bacterium]